MSAMSKMATKISALNMPPPPLPNSKSSGNRGEAGVTMESDAAGTPKRSSSNAAPSSESRVRSLRKFRPFAPIPLFSGLREIQSKPDATSLDEIEILAQRPKIVADRDILSKHQLPISQWPMYTAYVASVVDKQSTSANFNNEDILDYVYDWAAWAAEIPDPDRRSEVLEFVMRTLERVLRSGLERTGMMLGPNDVKGAKSGMKKTLHGDVNIQVVITSSANEAVGSKLAKQRAKDDLAKQKQAEEGVIDTMTTELAPELSLSIEETPEALLRKRKRLTSNMNVSDVMQDAKRQKITDVDPGGEAQAKATSTSDGQSQEQVSMQDRSSSESKLPLSSAEEDKRARYRQQIFQSRLNHILKKAGKVQSRGKCSNWGTVRARLAEAGVVKKYRNMMLRDFLSGHEAWNGDSHIDPNEELAHFAQNGFECVLDKAEAMEQLPQSNNSSVTAMSLTALELLPALNTESPIPGASMSARPLLQPAQLMEATKTAVDINTPEKLIVKLHTLQGFDPEHYSVYGDYLHENFMFNYTTTSTVKERVMISDTLISHVNAQLNTATDRDVDGYEMLYSGNQSIKNEKGRVVATGNFVDLNSDYVLVHGLADPKDPWSWNGRTFKARITGSGEI